MPARAKPGQAGASNQARIEKCESKFNELEGQLRQTSELETRRLDLDRQLRRTIERIAEVPGRTCSAARPGSRPGSSRRSGIRTAEKEQQAAVDEHQQRAEAAQRLVEAQKAVLPAKRSVEGFEQIVQESGGEASPAEVGPKRTA